ncbi:MAG: IPT/TIG domain-containing protein [Candidatus Melainabacteria bacterium]|nr:IPT/TIG domain-containing protein [Candidatus Melainabacteria bacterium]
MSDVSKIAGKSKALFKRTQPLIGLSSILSASLTLGLSLAACPAIQAQPAREPNMAVSGWNAGSYTLQTSRPLIARAGAWQTYNDHVKLKAGQQKRQLRLVFENGADGREKLTVVNILLNRQPLAALKDFKGNTLALDPSASLRPGDNLLTVKVFGPSGARLKWQLLTENVTVTSVKPELLTPLSEITISGTNFADAATQNQVSIGGKPATVVKASSTELRVKPPQQLAGGTQELLVISDSIKSNATTVRFKDGPKITWIDLLAGPPGQTVALTGTGFSADSREIIVTVGKAQAKVLVSGEQSIKFVVPEMHFPQWHLPVTVTVNGIKSREKITFNVDQRVVPNEGWNKVMF